VLRIDFGAGDVAAGDVGAGDGGAGDGGAGDVIASDGGADGYDRFATWDGSTWQAWDEEGWHLGDDAAPVTAEGYAYRITRGGDDVVSERGGYHVALNRGQLGDGSRGDRAYVYVTVHKPDEGDGDLLTIGPCCNDDAAQGPERFMAPPEPLDGADLVVWIVPQLVNSDVPGAAYCWAEPAVEDGRTIARTYPCAFGPLFVPIEIGE